MSAREPSPLETILSVVPGTAHEELNQVATAAQFFMSPMLAGSEAVQVASAHQDLVVGYVVSIAALGGMADGTLSAQGADTDVLKRVMGFCVDRLRRAHADPEAFTICHKLLG